MRRRPVSGPSLAPSCGWGERRVAVEDGSVDAASARAEARNDVLFVPGMTPLEAATALLSHRATCNGLVRLPGHHNWLDNLGGVQTVAPDCSIFEHHWTCSLPDTLDSGEATMSTIHQFALPSNTAEAVNASLRHLGASKYGASDGMNVSNEGGYHSPEQMWSRESGAAWYSRIHKVVLAALAIMDPSWDDDEQASAHLGPPGSTSSADVSGWLNASGAYDFNCLHHHWQVGSKCAWSAVYYVADGQPSQPEAREAIGDGDDDGLLGALLLQTRPPDLFWDAGSTLPGFGFVPVAPVPGCLWLFPTHLRHAVMPRALIPSASEGAAPAQLARPLRISVACNIYRAGERLE